MKAASKIPDYLIIDSVDIRGGVMYVHGHLPIMPYTPETVVIKLEFEEDQNDRGTTARTAA